ncbi:MAG: hypothetical protein IT448_09280 [Phycisphaerales bacterium]|nr:hypothetical protein [Phycisphaerales bacterium]
MSRSRNFRRSINVNRDSAFETLEARQLLADATVGINIIRAVGSENNPATVGRAWVEFTRTGSTASALNVNYSALPASTATAGLDYVALPGWATIPAGRSSVRLAIQPIDDILVEEPEVIVMSLTAGRYTFDSQKTIARLYIQDNDTPAAKPQVELKITKAVAQEANSANKATFTITRTGATTSPLNVSYQLTGTAVNGTDYQTLSGVATIAAGQSSVNVDLTAIEDHVAESVEWVRVSINAHANYNINWSKFNGVMYIQDSGENTVPGWWDSQWDYRTGFTFSSGSYARTDKPFVVPVNFTNALNSAGGSGSLITDSIRVVETTADGSSVVSDNVPFQFDPAAGYNAANNATGELVVLATGTTAAGATRYFHVYFDTSGSFTPASVSARITTTDNVTDEGQSAVRIQTQRGTYFYQKANGGFSSILDADGNDWLSFNPTPGSGSAGEYRGLPNAVFPGGGFHPGFTNATTTIVSQGPLRTVLRTDATIDRGSGGQPWSMTWEIYPQYATAHVTQASGNYWFLYEGTPGGSVGGGDLVVRSDGTITSGSASWTENNGLGSGNNSSWVSFVDPGVGRYLYLAQHDADNVVDSYYLMENNMTVFGFGRDGGNAYLTGQHSFTIGLADGVDFDQSAATINGGYRDVNVVVGSSQHK